MAHKTTPAQVADAGEVVIFKYIQSDLGAVHETLEVPGNIVLLRHMFYSSKQCRPIVRHEDKEFAFLRCYSGHVSWLVTRTS